MNIEPSKHNPLRWYQLRLSFMLMLITLVSVAMSLVPPWNSPNRECGHFTPHESRPVPQLEQAYSVILRSGSASTARWICLHDELAEEVRATMIAAACTNHPQTPPDDNHARYRQHSATSP